MVASVQALFTPDPTKQTQFRGVYPHNSGYRARFKINGRLESLGTAPTERAAAELVAARLTEVYGPGWPLLYRGGDARRARPWRVWRAVTIRKVRRDGRVRVVRRQVGWSASVWEGGRETVLGDHLHPADRRRDRGTRRPWVFATHAEAAEAVARWRREAVPRRWALLAPWAVWR